jgi:hypothetical protein
MKLYATIKNTSGKIVKLGSNEKIEIDIMIGNRLMERLSIQHEEDITEPMNTYQSTSGYTITTEYGKRLSFILDKEQGKK